MTQKHAQPPDSLPGDFIGKDSTGRVRIDRVIPLPWVMGVIGAGIVNAAAMYYGQQQLIEKVGEMRSEIRAITAAISLASTRDTEHSMRLQSLERRMDQIEGRRP
jgi:hypothetical protein